MTAHEARLADDRPNPGGATVADLRLMNDLQALAVLMFRDSFEGSSGRGRVRGLLHDALGATRGAAAFAAWSDFLRLLTENARRPLIRHAPRCTCVGADEAVLAQILESAALGEREDAMLTLALLVPADRLGPAILRAERIGAALCDAARNLVRTGAAAPSSRLH